MRKYYLLMIIIIMVITAGCESSSTKVTIDEVLESENTTIDKVKDALNSLDESSDDINEYSFYKYSRKHEDIVDSEEFNEKILAQVNFYYAKKDDQLVFVFPPKLDLIGDDGTEVKALFNTSYIMDGNKLVISTRIKAEQVLEDDIRRLIEMIAISIKL